MKEGGMTKRGRPARNRYDVLRMQRVYGLFQSEKGDWPITYYDMGKRLVKAFGITGRAVSPHTCLAIARRMRYGLYARPGREYISALAKALAGPYAHIDHPLGEDLILAKLRAVRKGDGVEYLSSTYMQRLFTSRDSSHPYFTIFTWLDDVDVAIDIAEILFLDPVPETIDAIAERIVRRSVQDRSMQGWELPRWIGDFLHDAGKTSDMVYAASSIVLVYASLREKIFNVSRAVELAGSNTEGSPEAPGSLERHFEKYLEMLKAQGLLKDYNGEDVLEMAETARRSVGK